MKIISRFFGEGSLFSVFRSNGHLIGLSMFSTAVIILLLFDRWKHTHITIPNELFFMNL